MRISEHVEALRGLTGELVSETVSPDFRDRLTGHLTGARQALTDLESIAATIGQRDSTCSGEDTSP